MAAREQICWVRPGATWHAQAGVFHATRTLCGRSIDWPFVEHVDRRFPRKPAGKVCAKCWSIVERGPKPMKAGDYDGALVKLRRSIQTRGGQRVPAGPYYVVDGVWRGRLTLRAVLRGTLATPTGPVLVRGVERHAVDVVLVKLA